MRVQPRNTLGLIQVFSRRAEAGNVAVLAIRNLEVCFGTRQVLRGASLQVEAGEVVGLTGANGTGKSTLLRVAAGLLRRIGWSTSGEASFTRRLSLGSNLETIARLAGLDSRTARGRIESLAERLGFREHLRAPADQCSSGIRQRAALGRALLHTPRLLLLDEPLRGVDAASAPGLAQSLRAGWQREAVVWVSHSREEPAAVANRTLVLEAGVLHSHTLAAGFAIAPPSLAVPPPSTGPPA
jgi:ABC-type multidrug transport system ATPase subunit